MRRQLGSVGDVLGQVDAGCALCRRQRGNGVEIKQKGRDGENSKAVAKTTCEEKEGGICNCALVS
jgi:hypothetical protein